ncbi:hypothetical protein J4229_02585 [Candidatus Pacearchaeota archaeon]|nr:hypothetical protein [Candidatus Pacearchaeota archaeon]
MRTLERYTLVSLDGFVNFLNRNSKDKSTFRIKELSRTVPAENFILQGFIDTIPGERRTLNVYKDSPEGISNVVAGIDTEYGELLEETGHYESLNIRFQNNLRLGTGPIIPRSEVRISVIEKTLYDPKNFRELSLHKINRKDSVRKQWGFLSFWSKKTNLEETLPTMLFLEQQQDPSWRRIA